MAPSRRHVRFLLLGLGILSLLVAMWAGLVRMGWALPPVHRTWVGRHGPLMVAGFLGTVISLERAVALMRAWTYLPPVLTGLGGLVLLFGLPAKLGIVLITLGSLGLIAVFGLIVQRQPALFTLAMALAAVLWAVGNALWLLDRSIPVAVPWWIGFLVMTIAGERLEMTRLTRMSAFGRNAFLAASAVYLAGLVTSAALYDLGIRVAGVGLAGLGLWLLQYDVARRTVRQRGLPRFIAVALLAGYGWLTVAGVQALTFGGVMAGVRYDAILHAIFLGFVMSMIFAHAPVIFPAVLGVTMPYRPVFYAHLALLHLSLLLRIAGDLAGSVTWRQWGGMLNVIALLLFLGNSAWATHTARARA